MSGIILRSAGSKASGALIGEDGKLHTRSLTVGLNYHASEEGYSFLPTTDFLTISTTTQFSGIFRVLNTSATHHMHIDAIYMSSDHACQWKFMKNATEGTLMSGGTAISPQNVNFASGIPFTSLGTALQGQDSATVTDGNVLLPWYTSAGPYVLEFDSAIYLGNSDSLSVMCKPAASASVSVAMLVHFDKNGGSER